MWSDDNVDTAPPIDALEGTEEAITKGTEQVDSTTDEAITESKETVEGEAESSESLLDKAKFFFKKEE